MSLKNSAAFFISIMFYFYCYGWMATLKIMQHDDGHIIRLAGDVHLEGFRNDENFKEAIKQEENFLINVEEPLNDFFNNGSRNEYFVVEKVICNLFYTSHFISEILARGGIAALPLITRINILADVHINSSIKNRVANIVALNLQPQIEIIAYDVRSKYRSLSLLSFPTNADESELFHQELERNQDSFKNDVRKLIDTSNQYHHKFRIFILNRGNSLIEKIENKSKLEEFFIYDFAEFAYLAFIAKNSHRNITLYGGIVHCHVIAHDLEKIGYKIIFERGMYKKENFKRNIIPGYRSKKDYQDFFCII